MSESGMRNRGRPDALVEASHMLFLYCGGSGAGGCITPPSGRSAVFSFQVPKFITYNRRLVLENKVVSGLRFWNNAGSDGICPNSLGVVESPFWVAFTDNGILDENSIETKGIRLSGALPYNFEVPADHLPQPVLPNGGGPNPNWVSIIYVHVFWKTAGLMNEGGVIGNRSVKIAKHDYDIVL